MKTIKFLLIFLGLMSFSAMATPPSVEYWAYLDNDLDGHASAIKQITADQVLTYVNAGWFVVDHKPLWDCNDNDDLVFHSTKVYIDNDGDKYANTATTICMGSSIPAGYVGITERLGVDCDDNDPAVYRSVLAWIDKDQDKVTDRSLSKMVCIGAADVSPDPAYTLTTQIKSWNDCDDNDATLWRKYCCYLIGSPISTPNVELCVGDAPPAGYGFCPRPTPPANADLTFSVYPNPVSDRLNITPNENWNNRYEIRLVDQFGRVARTVNNNSAMKGQAISINTGDLKPGVYSLIIRSGELVQTKSIAVKL